MNLLLPLLALPILLLACSANSQTDPGEADPNQASYELVELDAYSFRRVYLDQEGLKEAEPEAFMNRNPEAIVEFNDLSEHPLYALLTEQNIRVDGTLKLSRFDSLPEPVSYQFSRKKQLQVTQPEQIWVSDIPYIGKRAHPMYLSLVTDASSKKIRSYKSKSLGKNVLAET